MKERFSRPPFIKYTTGDTWGLVGFDKALSEDDIQYVKEHVKALGSKPITWSLPDGKFFRLVLLRSHTRCFTHSNFAYLMFL